ncbi:CRISPR-associated protein Cas9 [Spiroplasma litorale]|uniref:CRISPR-associated endonuclease Cas9 n=1 Tax=Spiroplasma litorale TaxID=216942 RepID=A0A0K1W1S6_9MOLU|nr:type II CRISPR RNA-guided endonuclease Cas9 [Spiroplasma litorale]AKX34259.1 CRISPR-associated protein Cas9 [Spiroplasma litorale]
MKKVNIGLDIGIASVGWSIYDIDNKKIINAGSRLFSESNSGSSNSSTTSDRRMQRGRRRNLRRLILRKQDLLKLFVKYNYLNKTNDFYNLNLNINYLEMRKKALKEKIAQEELIVLLFNYIKKRGSFNYKDDLLESKKDKFDDISIDDIKKETNLLPVEIQTNIFNEYGKYRGVKETDSLIAHEWYKKELEQILNKQVEENVVSQSFVQEYINLFDRKRLYFEGPGWTTSSKTSKSEYGWKDENEFYSRLTGFDTYNSNEKRAPKHSMTSYLFNILNDLNNINIDGIESGLTYDQKYELIESVINHNGPKNKNITLKLISSLLKVKESDIKGYRIDKENKPNFTKFEFINKLRTLLINSKLDISFISLKNIDLLDKISEILTIYQTAESRKEKLLIDCDYSFSNEQAEVISFISLTGTHSLSFKTMKVAIDEMWYDNKNHMQIFAEKNIKPDYNIKINRKFNSMPLLRQKISEMYISPVVKRSLIESIKIIKEIEKIKDLQIKDIVIELARESNSSDFKKYINEIQKKNEIENKEILEKHKVSLLKKDFKTRLKLILFNEQDGRCAYSGTPIDIDRLYSDPNYCEIDHIIPFSVSLDDSRTNKVLVLWKENQDKGKKSPYQYFRDKNRNWNEFKEKMYSLYVKNKKLGKYGNKKYSNLVLEEDINDVEVKQKFINRNLNDTRYATVEVKNYLTFFKKELNKSYSIKTINGGLTSYIRNVYLKLPKKDRDDYKHHAIDATICAIAPIIDLAEGKTLNKILDSDDENIVLKLEELGDLKNDINNFAYKFTKKVEKKSNTQLFNESIYRCINDNGNLIKTEKIDLLSLEPPKIKIIKELFTTNKNKLLIYESDKKTFDYLENIYKAYVNDVDKNDKPVKNPFYHFVNELGERITKQSNENTPPSIRYLRYKGSVINQYTKITHKFNKIKANKEIVMIGSNTIGWDLFYSKVYNLYKVLPITHNVAYFESNKSSSNIKYKLKKYESEKILYKIDETYEKKFTLHKNNELVFDYDGQKFNLIVVGFDKTHERLEFKYLYKKVDDNKRLHKTVKKMKNIKLITSNSTRTKVKIID